MHDISNNSYLKIYNATLRRIFINFTEAKSKLEWKMQTDVFNLQLM